jgi:hypothetical protein
MNDSSKNKAVKEQEGTEGPFLVPCFLFVILPSIPPLTLPGVC